MDFYAIQKEVHEIAEAHGWHDQKVSFGEFIALCHSELSEALEEYRKESPFHKIEIELADVVIRIMDYSQHMGVDLEKCILEKNEINKKRPYRHGNKRL